MVNNHLLRYVLIRLGVLVALLYVLAGVLYHANADDYIDGSLGIFNTGKPNAVNVKFFQVGSRQYLGAGFFNQYDGGFWVQTDTGDGRKSSAYIADQLGIEAENVIVVRFAVGPSLITTPDSYLGGYFQFTEDLFIGFKGTNGNTIGLKYKHFSSAGLEMPNKGRDFAGLEINVPW